MCRACIVFNQLEAWGISPSKFIRNVRRCSMCRTKRQINSGPTTGKCLVESLTQIFYFKFLLIGARYTKRERERLLRVCACAYDKFSVAVQLFFIEAMDCAFSHPASFPLTPALAVGHKEARSPLLCKHLLLKKQHGNSAPPPPPVPPRAAYFRTLAFHRQNAAHTTTSSVAFHDVHPPGNWHLAEPWYFAGVLHPVPLNGWPYSRTTDHTWGKWHNSNPLFSKSRSLALL